MYRPWTLIHIYVAQPDQSELQDGPGFGDLGMGGEYLYPGRNPHALSRIPADMAANMGWELVARHCSWPLWGNSPVLQVAPAAQMDRSDLIPAQTSLEGWVDGHYATSRARAGRYQRRPDCAATR